MPPSTRSRGRRSGLFQVDARTLARQIFETEADLLPDTPSKTLTVRIHHLTQAAHDEVLGKLCVAINETQTVFPGTDLTLIFKIGSSEIPPDQERQTTPCWWQSQAAETGQRDLTRLSESKQVRQAKAVQKLVFAYPFRSVAPFSHPIPSIGWRSCLRTQI